MGNNQEQLNVLLNKIISGTLSERDVYSEQVNIIVNGERSDWQEFVEGTNAELDKVLPTVQINEQFDGDIRIYTLLTKILHKEGYAYEWAYFQYLTAIAFAEYASGYRQLIREAISCYRLAATVLTKENYRSEWISIQRHLGACYLKRSDGETSSNIETAIGYLTGALTVLQPTESPFEWTMIQNILAETYLRNPRGEPKENINKAIMANMAALEVLDPELNLDQYIETYLSMAKSSLALSTLNNGARVEYVILMYQEILALITEDSHPEYWAMTWAHLSNAYHQRNLQNKEENAQDEIRCCMNALKVYTQHVFPQRWAAVQVNLGLAYFDSSREKTPDHTQLAIQCYHNALRVYTKEQAPNEHVKVLVFLGNIQLREGFLQEAYEYYKEAHELVELNRGASIQLETRIGITQEYAQLSENLIYCCLNLQKIAEATFFGMASKNRTLTDQLSGQPGGFESLLHEDEKLKMAYLPIEAMQAELEVSIQKLVDSTDLGNKEQINRWERAVFRQRKSINHLVDNLIFQFPSLTSMQAYPSIGVVEAQQLSEIYGAVLIEFIVHGDGYGAFVISADLVEYVDFGINGAKAENFKVCIECTNLLSQEKFWEQDDWKERLHLLYNVFFEGLEPYLPPNGKLVIAPIEGLFVVPFHALIDGMGHYLVDRFVISYVPSITTLHALHRQWGKRSENNNVYSSRLLTIAHPGEGDEFLEDVVIEVEEIKKYFDMAIVLADEDATLASIIDSMNKEMFQVIHIATHGHFDYQNPYFSGLFIANQQVLTIDDIRLKIRLLGLPLVTLSSCQTGRIRSSEGNESIGLSWAFLAAGAAAILSSQWAVYDTATRELLQYFYENRLTGHMAEAEALRLAMQRLRQHPEYADNPIYWAAFQITGLPVQRRW